MLHSASQSIHLAMYVQTGDPGAVGAKKFWLDITNGTELAKGAVLKKRNAGNTAWDLVARGPQSRNIATKSAAYTATPADDVLLVDASGAARTITLPAVASSANMSLTVKKIDTSANTVTVDANASELIDGALTVVLPNQWDGITIVCDGAAWYIV